MTSTPFSVRLLRRIESLSRRRRFALCVSLLGVLLTAPSIATGLAQDDYYILTIFERPPILQPIAQPTLNTFTFSEGDLDRNLYRRDIGILPWWADPAWKVDLWRPLAAATHWVDWKLFGRTAWPMHLHSLALYGLTCALALALFRQRLPLAVAGLAGLIFAIDSGHGIPVGWLANRSALLGCLFGLGALYAHDAWRGKASAAKPFGAWWPWAPVGVVLTALGLLSAEGAVSIGAYLFAHAVFMDPLSRGEKDRFSARGFAKAFALLLPYLAVVAAWRAMYSAGGHGTYGSGLYVDPVGEWPVFAETLPPYLGALLLALFTLPESAAIAPLADPLRWAYAAAAFGVLAVLGQAIRPLLRESATARYYLLGAVLAILPACATVPSDRNLMMSSIGAAGLVALYLSSWLEGRWGAGAWPRRMAAFLIVCHLVVAPVALVGESLGAGVLDRIVKKMNNSVPAATDKTVITLNTPGDLLAATLPLFRPALGQELPGAWRWLYAGTNSVRVEREDERTLVLRPANGFFQNLNCQIFRRETTNPMRAGDAVRLPEFEATVLEASPAGEPLAVAFRFERPLDHPSYVWMIFDRGEYVPYSLPAPGESAVLGEHGLEQSIRDTLGI